MKHILPTELVNRVLTYLATRPYTEVTQLIKDIQSLSVPYNEECPPEISGHIEEVPSD